MTTVTICIQAKIHHPSNALRVLFFENLTKYENYFKFSAEVLMDEQQRKNWCTLQTKQEIYSLLSTKILMIGLPSFLVASTLSYLMGSWTWKTPLAQALFASATILACLLMRKKAKKLQAQIETHSNRDIITPSKASATFFSLNQAGQEEAEHLSKELGIPKFEVLKNAILLYLNVANQFRDAKGDVRVIEIRDGSGLARQIDISEIMPPHQSHLKVSQ